MLRNLLGRLLHKVRLLAYSLQAIGPWVLARNALRLRADPEATKVDSGFDAKYGTDTNADLTPSEAAIPSRRRGVATMYLPTLDEEFEAMLDALAWPESLLRQTTFVDVGSGKARVVMLAAMRNFREAVGVELSPVLHAIAERNVAILEGQLKCPVRLELADATELAVPRGPFIAYLYHPFRDPIAALVMDRLLASLEANPRPAAILYGHPTLQRCIDPSVFARGGVFRDVANGERMTRHFRIGWSVWTNQAWLDADEPISGRELAVTGA
jgi:hypothetical protein